MREAAADDGHDARPTNELRREEGQVDGAEDPDGLEVVQLARSQLAEPGRHHPVNGADLRNSFHNLDPLQ